MGKSRSLRGLRTSFRKSIINDGEKITKRELPIVKGKIIASSLSSEWEEARREWECIGVLEEEEYDNIERFSERCELCNQGGLKTNYEISNPSTGKKFMVGSTCIKNFLILKGAESQEQSTALFEFQVKQMLASKRLQALLPTILQEPTQHDALIFRNSSKDILGSLDVKDITGQIWDKYIKLLFGSNSPEKLIERVKTVLFQPSKIIYKRVKDRSTGQEDAYWTRKAKVKTRVKTTLRKSKEDRPDKLY